MAKKAEMDIHIIGQWTTAGQHNRIAALAQNLAAFVILQEDYESIDFWESQ